MSAVKFDDAINTTPTIELATRSSCEMNKLHMLPFLFVAGFACTGCSDSTDSTEDPDPVNVKWSMTINDWLSGGPIAGAEICTTLGDEAPICITTDADGKASADVTDPTPGAVAQTRVKAEGYFPFLIETTVPDTPTDSDATWVMAADGVVTTLTDALGGEADPAKGHFTFSIFDISTEDNTPIEGATVTLTGGTAEYGPNYLNDPADLADGIFGSDGKTTAAGLVAFNNVDPGEAKATVEVDGKTCTVGTGGSTSNDGEAVATIVAGFVTYVTAGCQ